MSTPPKDQFETQAEYARRLERWSVKFSTPLELKTYDSDRGMQTAVLFGRTIEIPLSRDVARRLAGRVVLKATARNYSETHLRIDGWSIEAAP